MNCGKMTQGQLLDIAIFRYNNFVAIVNLKCLCSFEYNRFEMLFSLYLEIIGHPQFMFGTNMFHIHTIPLPVFENDPTQGTYNFESVL